MGAKIRIFHNYQQYADPELTEIFKRRGRKLGYLNVIFAIVGLFALIASIAQFGKNVLVAILGIVCCVGLALLYCLLLIPLYNRHTNKILAERKKAKLKERILRQGVILVGRQK